MRKQGQNIMPVTEKAEKVSITLPYDMLVSIKDKVREGLYGSTSEVIREAMRLWQQQQDKHEAQLALIRARLESSASSGLPIPIEQAFDQIEKLHQQHMNNSINEDI